MGLYLNNGMKKQKTVNLLENTIIGIDEFRLNWKYIIGVILFISNLIYHILSLDNINEFGNKFFLVFGFLTIIFFSCSIFIICLHLIFKVCMRFGKINRYYYKIITKINLQLKLKYEYFFFPLLVSRVFIFVSPFMFSDIYSIHSINAILYNNKLELFYSIIIAIYYLIELFYLNASPFQITQEYSILSIQKLLESIHDHKLDELKYYLENFIYTVNYCILHKQFHYRYNDLFKLYYFAFDEIVSSIVKKVEEPKTISLLNDLKDILSNSEIDFFVYYEKINKYLENLENYNNNFSHVYEELNGENNFNAFIWKSVAPTTFAILLNFGIKYLL